MQLRSKVCLPLVGITLVTGIICYAVIQKQFERLNETSIQNLVEAKSSQVLQAIELCREQAKRMRGCGTRFPHCFFFPADAGTRFLPAATAATAMTAH